jgi:hypothetical protein
MAASCGSRSCAGSGDETPRKAVETSRTRADPFGVGKLQLSRQDCRLDHVTRFVRLKEASFVVSRVRLPGTILW